MDLLKRYPAFFSIIILLVLAFFVEVVLIFVFRSGATAKINDYKSAVSQRQSMVNLTPKPTEANIEKVRRNVESLMAAYNRRIQEMRGEGMARLERTPPGDPNELYFNIQKLVDDLRQEADREVEDQSSETERGKLRPYVKVDPKFAFGFGFFIDEGKGPVSENIRKVWIQRNVIEHLVRKLFAAEPVALLGVERQPIEKGAVNRTPPPPSGNTQKNRDLFYVDPHMSAYVPGLIETMAFRLTFTATTETLRKFLTELAKFEYPLIVRSIEVAPAPVDRTAAASQSKGSDPFGSLFGGGAGGNQPEIVKTNVEVVGHNLSRFTLVIELIDIQPLTEEKLLAQEQPAAQP